MTMHHDLPRKELDPLP